MWTWDLPPSPGIDTADTTCWERLVLAYPAGYFGNGAAWRAVGVNSSCLPETASVMSFGMVVLQH